MATTRALKTRLRKEVAERLAAVDDATLAANSAAVHAALHALLRERFATAATAATAAVASPIRIGLYASFPRGEVSTDPLVASLLRPEQNPPVHLYFPRIVTCAPDEKRYPAQKTRLQFQRVPSLAAFRSLVPTGPYKIREPHNDDHHHQATAPVLVEGDVPLDVLVLPGVAFAALPHDKRGVARLGHGAGYYDDFLVRHAARFGERPRLCVGLALPEQLLAPGAVPMDDHDEIIDAVIGSAV